MVTMNVRGSDLLVHRAKVWRIYTGEITVAKDCGGQYAGPYYPSGTDEPVDCVLCLAKEAP